MDSSVNWSYTLQNWSYTIESFVNKCHNKGTQHREQMATGRNRIKSTDLAWYWITHHAHMISFQTADLCAASFDAHV